MTPSSCRSALGPLRLRFALQKLLEGCNYKPTVRPFVDSTTSRRIDRPMRLPGPISWIPGVLRQRRQLEDDISDVSRTLRRRDRTHRLGRKLALTITAAGEGHWSSSLTADSDQIKPYVLYFLSEASTSPECPPYKGKPPRKRPSS